MRNRNCITDFRELSVQETIHEMNLQPLSTGTEKDNKEIEKKTDNTETLTVAYPGFHLEITGDFKGVFQHLK